MTSAGRERLAYQQAERYAQELRELYDRDRAQAEALQVRREKRARIQAVLDGKGLRIVLQPIFRLSEPRPEGFEALARFDSEPSQGPDMWFRDAAEAGMGVDLELAATREALSHLGRLPPDTYLSLNLSPSTAMSTRFSRLLDGDQARRVVIEVTEHAPVEDYTRLAQRLGRFRDLGGRLAVDDAGAGFASLRHILALDPDIIKLDISLTRGVDTDRARRAVARALIFFAIEIGASIVAEGIESQTELDALRELGASHGQGFFLGRPMSVEEATSASR